MEQNLENKIDALTAQVAILVERDQRRAEMMDEAMVVMKDVMAVATNNLDEADKKGWFAFARALGGVLEEVVENYSEEDVRELGNNVVGILDTVRHVTQPEVLAIATQASQAIEDGDNTEPVGVMGMLKASNDKDARRGMAVVLQVLKMIGQNAERSSKKATSKGRLESRLAPKRRAAPRRSAPRKQAAPAKAAKPQPKAKSKAVALVPGKEAMFHADGFMIENHRWDEDLAVEIAATLGVSALTDDHWAVVRYAREQYLETGTSPNVRKISIGSGVSTKTLYSLFPRSPGMATAMVAGIPKPAGCI